MLAYFMTSTPLSNAKFIKGQCLPSSIFCGGALNYASVTRLNFILRIIYVLLLSVKVVLFSCSQGDTNVHYILPYVEQASGRCL